MPYSALFTREPKIEGDKACLTQRLFTRIPNMQGMKGHSLLLSWVKQEITRLSTETSE